MFVTVVGGLVLLYFQNIASRVQIRRINYVPIHGESLIAPPYVELTDDFNSYYAPVSGERGELLDGKGRWMSSDAYYRKGWVVVSEGRLKCARFWPSPWPGRFSFDSNYLTYRVPLQGEIDKIILSIDYFMQSQGGIKVFISGDNSAWKEITDLLGFVNFNEPGIKTTEKDLSSFTKQLNLTTDLYIMFRTAAYSGDYWVFGLDRILIKIKYIQ
jgi:hypothetical protein